MEKIPNRLALHDFLANQCNKYVMSLKLMPLSFGKKVLSGCKSCPSRIINLYREETVQTKRNNVGDPRSKLSFA